MSKSMKRTTTFQARRRRWRFRILSVVALREGLFSYRSPGSIGSILSAGSAGSISSRASSGSVASIGSAASLVSIGSFASMASIASVRSIASIASVDCVFSIGSRDMNGAFFNIPFTQLLRGRDIAPIDADRD